MSELLEETFVNIIEGENNCTTINLVSKLPVGSFPFSTNRFRVNTIIIL